MHILPNPVQLVLKWLLAATAIAFTGLAISADLIFDQKTADEDATFRELRVDASSCMNESARVMLRMGERESERIVAFQMQACASHLVQYLSDKLGQPSAVAVAYAQAMAYAELKRIPGLSLAPPNPVTNIENLSESQFNDQFRCPETYSSEAERQQSVANMLKWYSAKNPTVTVDGVVAFRMRLLEQHQCTETLKNIAKANADQSPKLPTYNSKVMCKGKSDCIDGETGARTVLESIWPKAGLKAKEYCVSVAHKANNVRYLNLLNCLVAEDK